MLLDNRIYNELLYIEKSGKGIDFGMLTQVLVLGGYIDIFTGPEGFADARLTFKGMFVLFVCKKKGIYTDSGKLRLL